MKRWPSLLLLVATVVVASESCAQGSAGGPARAGGRDTTRVGTRYVYLIRHAWYDGSDPRDERIGKGIDSLGRAQAKFTAERLAAWPFKVDLLVSSTFTRARETADVIGEALHMPAVRDSEISECTPPSNRPDYGQDQGPGDDIRCKDALDRAYARYFRPAEGREDRHEVLVAHGNVIRYLVSRAMNLDLVRWPDLGIGNCSITAFAIRADGVPRLVAFSDTGHLPLSAQTWTSLSPNWQPPLPRGGRMPNTGARPTGRGVVMPAPYPPLDTLKHTLPTGK